MNNKSILITGGTGSWGNELTRQVLSLFSPKRIRILSRNENSQVMMKRKFKDARLQFMIGDVRDRNTCMNAIKGIDIVFHLAALKHVPVGEETPDEFIKTNINGTQNVRDACLQENVEKMVLVSTDKACAPINLYGYTKSIAEKITIQANQLSDKTKFICIRGGNALGSNGSVVPLFLDQIKNNRSVTVTHLEMTRFFLSLPQAVNLLFKATEAEWGVGTYIMKMPSFKIYDIAQTLIDSTPSSETTIEVCGMRPGEKLHEVLVSESESTNAYEIDDDYVFIKPEIPIISNDNINYSGLRKFPDHSFSSSCLKSKVSIQELLHSGGFV